MVSFRRSLLLVLGMLLMVAAFGGMTNIGTNSSSAHAMMPTQTPDNQYDYQQNGYQNNQWNQRNQGKGQMPLARTLIRTKQVNIHGRRVMILITFNGMTLYKHTTDRVPRSNCTGRCARVWPPLLSKGMVINTARINGKLTVYRTANGKQVEYNGHPLYTYSGDKAPGQTRGQGVGNVWYVVVVALQRQHY